MVAKSLRVDGTAPVVASDAGQVTVDLRALVNQVAARLGIGPFEGDRIPESVTTVALPQSENMANTIDLMRRLDRLGLWLGLIGVAGFAAAIALSRGFRRRAVTYWGAFVVFAGLVLHVNIALGRDWVPAQITDTPAWQRAYASIYDLYTQQLSLAANTLLLVGAIVLLSTWLLGDSRAALASRRRSAPVLREHALASWVGFAIVLYAMFTWLPALSSRSAQGAILLLVLATAGFWALRRELVRDTPFPATAGTPNWVPADADAEATTAVDARSKVEIAPKRVDDVASSDEPSDALDAIPDELREIADPVELDRFERLTALRDREVLSTEEYDAARELLVERLERRVARQSRQPAPGGD